MAPSGHVTIEFLFIVPNVTVVTGDIAQQSIQNKATVSSYYRKPANCQFSVGALHIKLR
jgi:hypothetical protein